MRLGVLALGGLLALPATAAAQDPGGFGMEPTANLVPHTSFAVTPWVGFRLGYGPGAYHVFTEGAQYRVTEARGGNAALGLNVEARISGPLNLVGAVAYSAGDQDRLTFERLDGSRFELQSDGPSFVFAKAGLQYRLPDPIPDNRRFHPAAYLTVAPAVVITDWPAFVGFDGVTDVTGSTTHFALNVGADAVSNIGTRGLALSLGFENYLTFWNRDPVRVRDEILFGDFFEEPVTISYDRGTASLLMMRIGLSWRF
jgi:hypothetical protein